MRRRGHFIPLLELKADKDKTRRAMGLQPWFENGAFFIKEYMKDFEKELLEFPLGKHDDTVDCAAYIPQISRKPGKSKGKGLDTVYEPRNSVTGY